MKYPRYISYALTLIIVLLGTFFNLACQYEYSSPTPGIIEVRLRTKSQQIAFDPLNNFVIKVSRVEAIRSSDNGRATIYEDLKSIKRSTNVYNTFDPNARDSVLVIGQTYLPPAEYKGVDITIQPALSCILDGYRVILVRTDPGYRSDTPLQFRSPFAIKENVVTQIVLTVDIDSTLQKRADSYLFQPKYYISSINFVE